MMRVRAWSRSRTSIRHGGVPHWVHRRVPRWVRLRVCRRLGSQVDWRKWLPLLAGLLLLVLAPALARAQGAPSDSVTLGWTAPGDDSTVGTATRYEMRQSLAPIDESNWSGATVIPGLPAPLVAGTRQRFTVHGLTYGTVYYFAIKTEDDAGNISGISNLVRWDWVYDTAPPAAPAGLVATREGANVHLRWSPNAEPDLAGYTVYRASGASGPYTALNGTLITAAEFIDTTLPQGLDAVWYQLSASDDSGNESARSASYRLMLASPATAGGTGWSLAGGYPNPSRIVELVRIPVVVPGSGPGDAVLDVLDAAGQRVRRIELAGLAPGGNEVEWDGRNDAGREAAPGVYRVLLIAGKTRQAMKLVRVP